MHVLKDKKNINPPSNNHVVAKNMGLHRERLRAVSAAAAHKNADFVGKLPQHTVNDVPPSNLQVFGKFGSRGPLGAPKVGTVGHVKVARKAGVEPLGHVQVQRRRITEFVAKRTGKCRYLVVVPELGERFATTAEWNTALGTGGRPHMVLGAGR